MAAGEKILIDAATGTEIEHRGVPQLENAWNGGGALSHPDIRPLFTPFCPNTQPVIGWQYAS